MKGPVRLLCLLLCRAGAVLLWTSAGSPSELTIMGKGQRGGCPVEPRLSTVSCMSACLQQSLVLLGEALLELLRVALCVRTSVQSIVGIEKAVQLR